jgi:AmmeMemoRadiSam system protein A/AmmeMemoRadiSam system protein B
MASIVFACISPHPPIIVHEVGQGRERTTQKTIDALEQVAQELAEHKPDTVILMSPHGPLQPNAFGILAIPECTASFAEWGAPQLAFAVQNDLDVAAAIRKDAEDAGLPLEGIVHWRDGLDWGCAVPLYYLRHGLGEARVVPMCISFLPPQQHFTLGQAVRRAGDRLSKRVAIIASADLSHALTRDAPSGYDPLGQTFDEQIQKAVADWDVKAVLGMEDAFRQRAAEDAVPSLSFLMGALDGLKVKPRVLSYEGPFGVGYLVAAIDVAHPGKAKRRKAAAAPKPEAAPEPGAHPLVRLAREAVEAFVRQGRVVEPTDLTEEMREEAGAFVTIRRSGQLRGCMGTLEPAQENVAREVVHNAIDSATRDPRFLPILPDELSDLHYSVDVLSPPEPVDSPDALDIKRYGVIVQRGPHRGLLLPDIEGVSSVEEQISVAKAKAGILPEDEPELFRFTVRRYEEADTTSD